MSINTPDYEIAETVMVASPEQLRAIADPLRSTLLDLVLERAATVAELATAVGRPKSTVAHHVGVLVDAGMLRVVRTRRVRAIDERFYGRTGRTLVIGVTRRPREPGQPAPQDVPMCVNALSVAASESVPAHEADTLYSTLRHARIPAGEASRFWRRVEALVDEFSALPREGDTSYGLAVGLYPSEQPVLPPPSPPPPGGDTGT
ncbi:ArsR/SmtB family transcription factor [Terracoccus luteus]|uniref:DNA-binding transcriptional ArsR family regulator n=1 Tax=Terracoccus luteus TaxID=53356 RepID=A0A839PWZ8_9MICO|nr:winged helix-turn-helix domain-containing protein [Terracoccus luteus]MBB2987613.1 DNA-binding transcriptional ArsR family regulator [Terracoccus luteus]MCP2173264.1 DNA-binding transcriptional ArsR family regulator [Terracoccus luteus]